MPPVDWDKLMAAKPMELSEEDMEEFYESLVLFNPEDESDTGRLQKMFDVSRVIMKAKNESCEEIMEDYDKEVKANVKQKMTIASKEKELQKKIIELEKYGGQGTTGGGAQRMVVDQMRDLEKQNEELTTELRDIQIELNKEKRAAENYSQKISQLENDLLYYREDKYGGQGTTGGGAQRMVVDQMRDLEKQNEELTTELRDIQIELNKEKRAAENYSQKISQLENDLLYYREDNERLRGEVSDYMIHMEAQRDKLVSTKGGKLDYREKMVQKNRDLPEAMKELQNLTDSNVEYQKQIEDMKAQIKEAVDMLSGTLMTTSKSSKSLDRVMQYRTN